MSFLADNLRVLRKSKGMTQGELAEQLQLNRSVIGAYEEGRAEPRLPTLISLAQFFNISLDALVLKAIDDTNTKTFKSEIPLRVLPIAVERESREEMITVVPVKAAAGYLDGYGDLDFIGSLPRFSMPVKELPQDQTMRMFQIEGESMLPLPEGSYVLASYVSDPSSAGGAQAYVVITKDQGIVFKRIENLIHHNGSYRLISENPAFPPYEVKADDVLELWKARAFVVFDLPTSYESSIDSIQLKEIRSTLDQLVHRINKNKTLD